MKPPLIRRSSLAHCRGEHGVTMALVAIAMVAIIAMAALSVDVVTLYLAREEAQRSADAAALAAARFLSLSGVTGDPNNVSAAWPTACNTATQIAKAVALENPIAGGAPLPGNVTVNFLYNGTSASGCTFAGGTGAFAINPQVQVIVQRPGLPTLFSRMWSRAPNSVSATATAEAYNPSNSGSVSSSLSVVPVNPRCVKPWMVPNYDPGNPASCLTTGNCNPFVHATTGAIQNPGIQNANGGVIGESFTLFADCGGGTSCQAPKWSGKLQANVTGGYFNGNSPPGTPNLQYLPGAVSSPSIAVPYCSKNNDYQEAIGGCDQSTVYQCGVPAGNDANMVDASENPGGSSGDTATGLACLLTNTITTSFPLTGQDTLNPSYPFVIKSGSDNPQVPKETQITSSKSIVTVPIYDVSGAGGTITLDQKQQASVTIVGFLQVFVNNLDGNGNPQVTVLNVAGCGNVATNAPVLGSSPVPVRLITPQ